MTNFFKELVKSEPRSINYIRKTLNLARDEYPGFIPLLKDHHDFLDESISVLMDKDSLDIDKQKNLIRFFRLLEMHAKAEQETLYIHLKANEEREARLEGYAGQDEHDVAFQLQEELLEMGCQFSWNEEIAAKAKVVASIVKNHIKEEENIMFPIAQRDLSKSELEGLGILYLEKCRLYLDQNDLDTYESWDIPRRTDHDSFRDVF